MDWNSGSEHRGTLHLGSPYLEGYIEQLVLSIILSLSCKRRPVHIQAALVIGYYSHVVIKGTTPGVGQGKELLPFGRRRSSPKSHSPRAGADGPRSITHIILLILYCYIIML